MSSSEDESENRLGNREEFEQIMRQGLLSDINFVMSPHRPARRVFDIEEAVQFADGIGQSLLQERRRLNFILCSFLIVLIFVVLSYTVLFILILNKVFSF